MNRPRQINYFDTQGNLCQIDTDDEIGIALLKRFTYWRKDFGENFQQMRQIGYFQNEIAFLNCLAKWNTQGQAAGHHWVYHPMKDWAAHRE